MIALYIGLAASFGSEGPEGKTFKALLEKFPWFKQIASLLPPPIANVVIVWLAILPAVTLSIIANTLTSTMIIATIGRKIEDLLKIR